MRATNWVGDAVMSIPALHALRKRFPRAHIAILGKPAIMDLYEREAFCDEIIVARNDGRRAQEFVRLAQRLRGRRFDCAILLQNAFEAAALVRIAGIPVRIGYNRDGRGWLLTQAVRVPKPGDIARHERFYYLELLRRAGIIDRYPDDGAISLSAAARAASEGRKHFAGRGITEPVIGVSPGAAYGGAKRWLPERFAQAAAQIGSTTKGTIAVFGTASERAICETVCEHLQSMGQSATNFAGATSVRHFIEMAAACSVYLTNDSGPMHIASALGVPTVVVFGPTDHDATGPTGTLSQVIREPVECSPCLLRDCPTDHRCMNRVTAQAVATAALHLIGNRTD